MFARFRAPRTLRRRTGTKTKNASRAGTASKKVGIGQTGLRPAGLAELVGLIASKRISGRIAKELLPELLGGDWEGSVWGLVEARGMQAINDPAKIEEFVK